LDLVVHLLPVKNRSLLLHYRPLVFIITKILALAGSSFLIAIIFVRATVPVLFVQFGPLENQDFTSRSLRGYQLAHDEMGHEKENWYP